MSARELLLERVNHLDEETARDVPGWLDAHRAPVSPQPAAASASATEMIGFARRYRAEPRRTADWMAGLRAGESE